MGEREKYYKWEKEGGNGPRKDPGIRRMCGLNGRFIKEREVLKKEEHPNPWTPKV